MKDREDIITVRVFEKVLGNHVINYLPKGGGNL